MYMECESDILSAWLEVKKSLVACVCVWNWAYRYPAKPVQAGATLYEYENAFIGCLLHSKYVALLKSASCSVGVGDISSA